MAQQKGKKVTTVRRRRERKNIESGAVQVPAVWVSAVPESPLRLQHRLQQRQQQRLLWNMV